MAILAGFGASVLVAMALAAIGILFKAEYLLVLCLGAGLVGLVIHNFVPNRSIAGAVLGAILCPATYYIYQLFMALFGYYYEEGGDLFLWMLVGSVVYGAYMGYRDYE